jgi:hypothetical protein
LVDVVAKNDHHPLVVHVRVGGSFCKRICDTQVSSRLLGVRERHAQLITVAKKSSELLDFIPGDDHKIGNARSGQGFDWVEDHRLIEHIQ